MKSKQTPKQLWGMVHVGALPGTPFHEQPVEKIIEQAVMEAKTLEAAGFTGVIYENMHDVPYLNKKVEPEITAMMAVIGSEIKKACRLSLGLQILAGANEEALSVAHAVGADWIRVEGFVFSHIADEGWMDASAGELLRLRRELGAEKIKIMADIKKKHSSHQVTSDVGIAETAQAAEFFGADAVIVTGSSTGQKAALSEVEQCKGAVNIPVLVGSGLEPSHLKEYAFCDGFIIGSALKENGNWKNPVSQNAAQQVTKIFKLL